MTEIRCVVFDIDDTLYLERDYVRSGFRCVGEWVRQNLGIDDFSDLAWDAFEHGARGSIFDLVLQERGIDPAPDLVVELVNVYRTHAPDIALAPDARDCLERLHARLVLAMVTDGPLQSQRSKAEALELSTWIDPIVFTEELGPDFGKPNCGAFELVAEAFGCSAGECVYIADNPMKDFFGPKALGWKTIRVRRSGSLYHAIDSTAEVDMEVFDLRGSVALIGRLAAVGAP